MFDFEKLLVYPKAKSFHQEVYKEICLKKGIDDVILKQLKRASLSILLNLAEGTSRYTKPDRRNFYIISRGSVFECVSIFDLLESRGNISQEQKEEFYAKAEELSKMIFGLIKSTE